jgi:hypothetical protein
LYGCSNWRFTFAPKGKAYPRVGYALVLLTEAIRSQDLGPYVAQT